MTRGKNNRSPTFSSIKKIVNSDETDHRKKKHEECHKKIKFEFFTSRGQYFYTNF